MKISSSDNVWEGEGEEEKGEARKRMEEEGRTEVKKKEMKGRE